MTIAACISNLPLDELGDVVVVDNASPDDTVAVVRELGVPNIRLIETGENLGFGAGCNVGAKAVQAARFILFLNPDAVVHRGDIVRLARYLVEHPSVALVAPRLMKAGQPITPGGDLATLRSELFFVLPRRLARLLRDRRWSPDRAETGAIGYVEGACMLFDRDAFFRIGMFDTDYFLFFEEHDVAQRLRRAGLAVHLVADATAEHLVGASMDQSAMGARPTYYASTYIYLRKWRGRVAAAVYGVLARVSWFLLEKTHKLDPMRAAAYRSALKEANAG